MGIVCYSWLSTTIDETSSDCFRIWMDGLIKLRDITEFWETTKALEGCHKAILVGV
jgi:hypothetical protein